MSEEAAPKFSGVEKLTKVHVVGPFTCGKPPLDEWLKKYALGDQSSGRAKTYVVHQDNRVVGYYCLSAASIKTSEATKRAAAGQPGKGDIPVILLGRLATDVTVQKNGLGRALVKDALLRAEQAADEIGARAVLVHALDDEAKKFWIEKWEFEEGPAERTLMLLIKDIRAMLA